MCGITGIVGHQINNSNHLSSIKKMNDAIAHRGPDGEGQWIEDNIGIGHRRLAIIDLSPSGRQPMITRDHRYVLSYNGEIYNYQEIRKELSALGYKFQSEADSELY